MSAPTDDPPPPSKPRPKRGGARRRPQNTEPDGTVSYPIASPPPRAPGAPGRRPKGIAPPPERTGPRDYVARARTPEEDDSYTRRRSMQPPGEERPRTSASVQADEEMARRRKEYDLERRARWAERLEFYRSRQRPQAHIPFDAEARAVFLAALEEFGTFIAAADITGVSSATAYQTRAKEPAFAEDVEQALQRYRGHITAEAVRRAVTGWEEPVYQKGQFVGTVRKFSDRLMELLLKARGGTEWRDRVQVDQTSKVDATVTAAVGTAPLDTIAEAMRDPAKRAAMRALLGPGVADLPQAPPRVDTDMEATEDDEAPND